PGSGDGRCARPACAPGARGPSRCGTYWRGRPGGRWSPLRPRRLPDADAAAQVVPLGLRPRAECLAEVGARRRLQRGAERGRKQLDQLLGREATVGLQTAHDLWMGHQRVAVAERVEYLTGDSGPDVAGEAPEQR